MPSQWDHKADKDLLLAIIDEGSLKSIVWQSIAAKMKAKDYTFTHEACRQHFQKIRKESKSGSTATTSPVKRSAPSANSTPRKSQKTTTPKSSKSSSFASTYDEAYDDDEEEEIAFTPVRQRQFDGVKMENGGGGRTVQTASLFKVEGESENGRQVVDLENDDLYDEDH